LTRRERLQILKKTGIQMRKDKNGIWEMVMPVREGLKALRSLGLWLHM
jgi:hypothetical protein